MTDAAGSRVRIDAENRRAGMTLDELRGFVELADRVGMPGSATIRSTTGFRQQLQAVELRRS